MAVSDCMTQVRNIAEPPHADHGGGTVVHRPRATDAIGGALRRAFAPEQALPDHLARPLIALDGRR